MNFYKIYDEERKRTQYLNLDLVQCFFIDDMLGLVDFYYSENDHTTLILNDELIKKLKEIGVLFSKSEEKEEKGSFICEVKKVSLICDRCGEPFLHNVLFDKNGVSVNTIKSPLMCSKCMVYVKKNGG